MGATSIQWTDHSINPIRARHRETGKVGHYCEKVSAGCANCYSSRLQPRFGTPTFGSGQHRDEVEVFLDEGKLREVLDRKKPTKFFWCDMTDLFGDWVPDEMIDRCLATMALTPHHTHQVLTKRPERMRQYIEGCVTPEKKLDGRLGRAALAVQGNVGGPNGFHRFFASVKGWPWPLPNVWLGVSVENQAAADRRIPHLLATPAAVRFLSCEPLLGEVDLTHIHIPLAGESFMTCSALHATDSLNKGKATPGRDQRIDWVIVGGESGPGSRPCRVEWLRSLVAQCKAAGVACFVKQLGGNPEGDYYADREEYESRGVDWPDARGWNYRDGQPPIGSRVALPLTDRKGGDTAEWPSNLRVREFPTPRTPDA